MGLVEDLQAKVDTLDGKVDTLTSEVAEAVVTLQELKAIADNPPGGDNTAALQAISDKLDGTITKLTTATQTLSDAEDAADPTPDNPTP